MNLTVDMGLSMRKNFFLPKSITLLIKEQLLNEEKGMPKFISKHIVDKIGYDVIDKDKTILWNKLKSLERWIGANCCIETVEEIINMESGSGKFATYTQRDVVAYGRLVFSKTFPKSISNTFCISVADIDGDRECKCMGAVYA